MCCISTSRPSFWPMNSSARRIALSMPSARMSTFSRPSSSRSSLFHWITLRSGIDAFSTGTSSAMRSFAITKPPGVLRQVARKADQLLSQLGPQLADRRLGIEAVLAQAIGVDAAAVVPLLALRDAVDALQVDAERAADVAQRRARPVADDDCGQRGAMTAVLRIDVLDHLLAALDARSRCRCRAARCARR
jgi:hypothetical protein